MGSVTGTSMLFFNLLLQLYFVDRPRQVLFFMNFNPPFFYLFLLVSSSIPVMVSMMFTINYFIKKASEEHTISAFSKFIINLNTKLMILLMVIYEYVFYMIACNTFMYVYFCTEYRQNLGLDDGSFKSYFIIGLTIIFNLVGSIIVHIKVYYLRPVLPKLDFFGKTGGISENVFLCVILFNSALSGLRASYYFDNHTLERILYGVQMGFYGLNLLIYLKELPFFDKYTERMFAHLFTTYFIYTSIDVFYVDKIQGTLKLWSFLLPLQLILITLYIRSCYNQSYISEGLENLSLKKLKHIYLYGITTAGETEKFKRIGLFKEHMSNCKKTNCSCRKLWQKISIPKRSAELLNEEDLLTLAASKEDQDLDVKAIDRFIFKSFAISNPKNVFGIMIFLTWEMEHYFSLREILDGLLMMSKQCKSFKEELIYKHTNEEMRKWASVYYYSRELIFNEDEELKNVFDFSKRFKEMNKEIIDFFYSLEYKNRIEKMVGFISKFAKLNSTYLKNVNSGNGDLRGLNTTTQELELLKDFIHETYEQIEDNGRVVDFYHIPPYFYFVREGLNLYKTASRLYTLYKQRLMNKAHLIDRKNRGFENLGMFYNSLITRIAAEKKNFGVILDAFGDSNPLGISKEALMGKPMEYLIPNFQVKSHQQSCNLFMRQPIKSFMGEEILGSFLKLPYSEFIISSSYCFKLIPSIECGFDFIAGMKYDNYDSKMYMLVDKEFYVDSYSSNMKYLFDSPNVKIKTKIFLGEISQEIMNNIKSTENEMLLEKNKLNIANQHSKVLGTAISNSLAAQKRTSSKRNVKQQNRKKRDASAFNVKGTQQLNPIKQPLLQVETFIASIKLINSEENDESIIQLFQVSVTEKRSTLIDFRYYLLELIPSENLNVVRESSLTNSKQELGVGSHLDLRTKSKKVSILANQFSESANKSDSLKPPEAGMKSPFGPKSPKKRLSDNSMVDSMMVAAPKNHKTTDPLNNEENNSSSNGQSSLFNNFDLAVQKKYYSYEEALTRSAGFYEMFGLIAIYILAVLITISFTVFSLNQLGTRSAKFMVQKDIYGMLNKEGSLFLEILTRTLKRIAYNEKIFEKNRYAKDDYN